MTYHDVLQLAAVKYAIAGFCSAFLVDYHAFLSQDDAAKTFNFKKAAVRWTMGAMAGAATGGAIG